LLPERLPTDPAKACELASRWMLSGELAERLVTMANHTPFPLEIISGYRTAERQKELEQEGRQTAPDALSTHRSCPATGADLNPVNVSGLTKPVQVYIGEAATRAGLRWGGGSPTVPIKFGTRDTGYVMPSDWQHVDLGRRQQ